MNLSIGLIRRVKYDPINQGFRGPQGEKKKFAKISLWTNGAQDKPYHIWRHLLYRTTSVRQLEEKQAFYWRLLNFSLQKNASPCLEKTKQCTAMPMLHPDWSGGQRMIVRWHNEICNVKEIRPCTMAEIIQIAGAQTKEILYKRLSQRFDPLGVGCGYIFTSTSSRCSILFMHFQALRH